MEDIIKIVDDNSQDDSSEQPVLIRTAADVYEQHDKEFSKKNENVPNIVIVDENNPEEIRNEEEPEELKKPRNRRPLNTRPQHAQVSGLKNMLSAKDQEIMNLRAALERKQFEAQQAQQMAAHKDQIAIANHEYALKSQQEKAQQEMAEAMDSGDTVGAAKANQVMIDTATKLARLEELKNAPQFQQQPLEASPTYNYPVQEEGYPYEESEEIDEVDELEQSELQEEELERIQEEKEVIGDILRKNPWMVPNDPSFDELLNLKVQNRYKRMRRESIVDGDHEYANGVQILKDAVQAVISETKKTSVNNAIHTKRSSSMVSPVSRGGGSDRGQELKMSTREAEVVSRGREIMREKDITKLRRQYLAKKEELVAQGVIGHGSTQRHRDYVSFTTNKGGY